MVMAAPIAINTSLRRLKMPDWIFTAQAHTGKGNKQIPAHEASD